MENKINIAELLKDCPSGMELDCTMYDNLYFDRVDTIGNIKCYIKSKDGCLNSITFHENGCYNTISNAKCVIFPKGKTTWEGFVPPYQFKDGDVLTYMYCNKPTIYIYRENGSCNTSYYAGYSFENESFYKGKTGGLSGDRTDLRLATEDEKEKLFNAIKDNGYKWNAETKTLDKLIEPKFNVGDRIKPIGSDRHYIIKNIKIDRYILNDNKILKFTDEHIFELVPNKFDINTLRPFDKVLMRSSNAREWVATFYSHYNNNQFYGCGMCCNQCIPYEGNEHLLNTANECDNFFKVWEES